MLNPVHFRYNSRLGTASVWGELKVERVWLELERKEKWWSGHGSMMSCIREDTVTIKRKYQEISPRHCPRQTQQSFFRSYRNPLKPLILQGFQFLKGLNSRNWTHVTHVFKMFHTRLDSKGVIAYHWQGVPETLHGYYGNGSWTPPHELAARIGPGFSSTFGRPLSPGFFFFAMWLWPCPWSQRGIQHLPSNKRRITSDIKLR